MTLRPVNPGSYNAPAMVPFADLLFQADGRESLGPDEIRPAGGAGMRGAVAARRILLPIDLAKCYLGAFDVIQDFACTGRPIVTLLHVVALNVMATENRIYEELAWDAREYLHQLASKFLPPNTTTMPRIRFGRPLEEILAQAEADRSDLIVLPVYRSDVVKAPPAGRRRHSQVTLSEIARGVISDARCDVLVLGMGTFFNCEEAWGRPSRQPSAPAG